MQAHTTEGLHLHRQKAGRLAIPALVRTGAIAGLAGGMVMAMWQMIVGAVAQQPTAVPGIDTSFWTAHLRDPEPHDGGGPRRLRHGSGGDPPLDPRGSPRPTPR